MRLSVRILRIIGFLLLGVCAFVIGCISWAFVIETSLLFTRETTAHFPQWTAEGKPIRMAVIGDLHLSASPYDTVRLQRYVQRLMQLKPDLIVLVGDYARGSSTLASMTPEQAGEIMQALSAPYGVYAIKGNHDNTFGWERWEKAFQKNGIIPLSNQSTLLTFSDGRRLQLTGFSNAYRKNMQPQRISPDIPHILLNHTPDIDYCVAPNYADFIICGHTHGGQIVPPFHLLQGEMPYANHPFTYPWHHTEKNDYLITKGTGTSTLPMRFNCPPEIILLTLDAASQQPPSAH